MWVVGGGEWYREEGELGARVEGERGIDWVCLGGWGWGKVSGKGVGWGRGGGGGGGCEMLGSG